MHHYAVVVTYTTRSEGARDFLALACAFARETLQRDPGCLQYDVLTTGENQVLFIEVYRTRDAHQRHLQSSELAEFRRAREHLVISHTSVAGQIAN